MVATIDPKRLAAVTHLEAGDHSQSQDAMCVMEAVAWVTGEPWSYQPSCVCPELIDGAIWLNDDALEDDAERDRLLIPLIPRLVNTRTNHAPTQQARGWEIGAIQGRWDNPDYSTEDAVRDFAALLPEAS